MSDDAVFRHVADLVLAPFPPVALAARCRALVELGLLDQADADAFQRHVAERDEGSAPRLDLRDRALAYLAAGEGLEPTTHRGFGACEALLAIGALRERDLRPPAPPAPRGPRATFVAETHEGRLLIVAIVAVGDRLAIEYVRRSRPLPWWRRPRLLPKDRDRFWPQEETPLVVEDEAGRELGRVDVPDGIGEGPVNGSTQVACPAAAERSALVLRWRDEVIVARRAT